MAGIGLRLLPDSTNSDAYFNVQFYEPVFAAAFSSGTKEANNQSQFVGYQHSYGKVSKFSLFPKKNFTSGLIHVRQTETRAHYLVT
jgi:hypothetical protein